MGEVEYLSSYTGTSWYLRVDGQRVVLVRRPLVGKRGKRKIGEPVVVLDESGDRDAVLVRAYQLMFDEGQLYDTDNRTIEAPVPYAKLKRLF